MKSGFTLVEVLIVIAIIATLAVLGTMVASRGKMAANQAACASNMRQIGMAIVSYAGDNNGMLPLTSHSTGDSRVKIKGEWVNTLELSWVYQLAGYLDNVEKVRICPADEKVRRDRILKMNATSYLLNDVVFDPDEYGRMNRIADPARTAIMFISNRPVSKTWDHAHCAEWNTWAAINQDIATDRHRAGARAPDRTNGSANYLYADGHTKSIRASEMKRMLGAGQKPWLPEAR